MATADKRREAILEFAKGLADDGAHYLWGAAALRPTRTQSQLFAPALLSQDRAKESCFCAATNTVGNQVYVCAGRCSRMTGGGLIASPETDTLLKMFIERWAGKTPNGQYGWGDTLTPRMVKGDRIMDYRRGVDLTNRVVWGEGCDDTLHFDCGTFVRYVVQQVCGVDITGISTLQDPSVMKTSKGGAMGRRLKTNQDKVLPADILVWTGHVAFATGKGGKGEDQPLYIEAETAYQVAQAESAAEGVNFGKSHTGKPVACIRLSDDALTFKP